MWIVDHFSTIQSGLRVGAGGELTHELSRVCDWASVMMTSHWVDVAGHLIRFPFAASVLMQMQTFVLFIVPLLVGAQNGIGSLHLPEPRRRLIMGATNYVLIRYNGLARVNLSVLT